MDQWFIKQVTDKMGAQQGPSIVSVDFEVFGHVQGLYFTKYCRDMCANMGIGGWIKNSKSGSIVGKMQGDKMKVDEIITHSNLPLLRLDPSITYAPMDAFRNLNILAAADNEHGQFIRRMRDRRRTIRDSTDPFDMTDRDFVKLYRLPKATTRDFIASVSPFMYHPVRNTGISVDLKVLAALSFFATGSYQRAVGGDFNVCMSQPMVSRSIEEVCGIVNTHLLDTHIKFPMTPDERSFVKRRFYEETGFFGTIGAIDGTHIALVRPHEHEEHFFNRKGYHSKNVQAVCDYDMRILSINPKFRGASADAHVWRGSLVKAELERRYAAGERGEWLLGDSGYGCEPWLLTPILHADEDTPEDHYTKIHCRTRCCVERCFGLLKARWRCLLHHRVLHYEPTAAGKIINTCAVLHNIALAARVPPPEPLTVEEALQEQRMAAGCNLPNPADINTNFLAHARAVRDRVVRRLWDDRH